MTQILSVADYKQKWAKALDKDRQATEETLVFTSLTASNTWQKYHSSSGIFPPLDLLGIDYSVKTFYY